jgi:hypothetical protein
MACTVPILADPYRIRDSHQLCNPYKDCEEDQIQDYSQTDTTYLLAVESANYCLVPASIYINTKGLMEMIVNHPPSTLFIRYCYFDIRSVPI